MKRDFDLLPLFAQFIQDTRTGKRTKISGQRITLQTIRNYEQVFKLLSSFSNDKGFELRIRIPSTARERKIVSERNYWHRFYTRFSDYLYDEKKCFDNYVGLVMRVLKAFFNYLRYDKLLAVDDFFGKFYSPVEEIEIIALLPAQLRFLITDKDFEARLSPRLKDMKDVFVFGCTVALRCSDLFAVKCKDVRKLGGKAYLSVISKKTGQLTNIRLPEYLLQMLNEFTSDKQASSFVFPRVSLERFNKNIKHICELAGWCQICPKIRYRRGEAIEQLMFDDKRQYRFCDRISTHVMRRTAITTMVSLGMPENLVRKISGHSPNSKEFYRYVSYAQGYMDKEMDKVYQKLVRSAEVSF